MKGAASLDRRLFNRHTMRRRLGEAQTQTGTSNAPPRIQNAVTTRLTEREGNASNLGAARCDSRLRSKRRNNSSYSAPAGQRPLFGPIRRPLNASRNAEDSQSGLYRNPRNALNVCLLICLQYYVTRRIITNSLLPLSRSRCDVRSHFFYIYELIRGSY
jgi:hypothetical protein